MTSGEHQTKPASSQQQVAQKPKASARRVSQEQEFPDMTEAASAKRSPRYVSGCEDEDGAVLLRSGSPMRCVSEFDEFAASSKEESSGEQAQEAQAAQKSLASSSSSNSVPPLPNPLYNGGLRSNHVTALRLEAQLHPMRMILGRLMVHISNKKGLFNNPVDANELGLVDYHQVIKNPMDLGTVKARLYSIAYQSRGDVAADILMVFENAMTFNPPRNSVHVAARTLRDYFEDLYVAVGGEKKALPEHIAKEAEGKTAHGAPVPSALLSCRRVSFAAKPATAGHSQPSLSSGRTVSSQDVLASAASDAVAPPSAKDSSAPTAATSADPKSVPPTLCSTVMNSSGPTPNGLTELTAAPPGSPQGTRARANSITSPASFDLPKPTRRRRLSFAGKNRTVGHSCTSCLGRRCNYCEQGCLPLEPTLLVCNGGGCAGAKIRKNAAYFCSKDGTRHYCQRCFTSLPCVLPDVGTEHDVRYKRDLLRRKYDEELVEDWLTCSKCDTGVHHICAMHNSYVHSSDDYLCPGCVEPTRPVESANDSAVAAPSEAYSFLTGSENPVRLLDVADSSFRLDKDVLSADALSETGVSAFIETKVRERLRESCGVPNAEKTVIVRIVSDCDRCFQVPEVVRKHFRMPTHGNDEHGDAAVSPPKKVGYRSKAISLFQKVDGLDVCIFCMYVQEYAGNDEYDDDVKLESTSPQTKKRVYIAYLDSVEHFRPRHARTDLYHELLVSYLASARMRGFETAHIWACPPSRGNSFVFWNHPASQRTPSKERLISWYHGALSRALDCGVVTDVKSLYESDFQAHVEEAEKERSSGKMVCPPLLEGDFWIEEAVRIHAASLARHVKAKSDGKAANDTSSAQPSVHPWDPCPASQISSLLADSLIAHASSSPFRLPVNAAALKLKDYHKIITKPMDLGTVYSKCVHGEFHTLGELVADVQLVFANAKRYNPPGNFVHDMAIEMEDMFLRELSRITATWESDPGEGAVKNWHAYANVSMGLDTRLDIPETVTDYDSSSTLGIMHSAVSVDLSDAEQATVNGPSEKPQAMDADNENKKSPEEEPLTLEALLTGGPEAVSRRMAGEDKWMLEKKSQLPQKRPSVSKKGSGKRRRSSLAPSLPSDEGPSSKRRRQTWLGEEVGASVRSMRTSFFACSLVPTPAASDKEQEKASAYAKYTSSFQSGAEPGVISSRIADARHALLEFSQYRNLEFATLRHAKYSTAVLLYHLHNHDAPGMVPICTSCKQETVDCRWHKVTKIEELRKAPINKKRPGRPVVDDDKSKYQAEELCNACHAKHPKKNQFIPLHVTLSSS